MEERTTLKTVTAKDLVDIFVKRLWIMVCVAIIVVSSIFIVNKLTYEAEYSSTATLYILGQNDSDSSISEINTKISIATKIVNDCTHMIKSHTVLDYVIDSLSLSDSITYAQLKQNVSTNNPTDTRILEVTAKASSPEEAKLIVDAVCKKAKVEIARTVGFEQVNIFEEGVYNSVPCNETGLATYILIAIVTAMIVYGVFFVIFMFDDSIWTDEEIDKYLGLSVIGDIPDANSTHKKSYGYRKYRGYVGKYSAYKAYSAYNYNDNDEENDENGGTR